MGLRTILPTRLGLIRIPTWQVLLPADQKFSEITIVNRTRAQDRLRDITVQVVNFTGNVNTDFTGGTVVYTSELLNPANALNGPSEIVVDVGSATGNMIRVRRTPESETGNNARTLSINEMFAEGPEPIESFGSTRPTIAPGDPVHLDWVVAPDAVSIEIDGVGNVLPQTSNGTGSIIINAGPSVATEYELVVTDINGTSTATTTVDVFDEPIIYSFTGRDGFIQAGTTVDLTWEVGGNTTSLTLDGADVLGTDGITVTPTANTQYLLEAGNGNGSTSSTVALNVAEPGVPVINEFLAANDEGLLDEDGDASDWIELHNPGTGSLSTAGYFLSDDPAVPAKWEIPGVTIAPGGYLVIFASGKDRFNPSGELHTNFELSSDGEYLALIKPDGVSVASEYSPAFPDQRTDVSFGFDGVRGLVGYLQTPTPGTANGTSVAGFVRDTDFTQNRGVFSAPIQVGISSLTEGAQIRYTLDGTKPNATTGIVYSAPLEISQTTVLRAAAFKDGFEPTNVDTQTYIFPADVVLDPNLDTGITQDPAYQSQLIPALSSLPSISLNFADDLGYDEQEASIEMINFEDGNIQADTGMSRFGGLATDFAKRSIRIRFKREFGPGKLDFQLFGGHEYSSFQPADQVDSIDIRAGNHDMAARGAYLSNRYSDDALLDMGQIAPHGRFIHLYLNGRYWGQYHLREGWNASMLSEYFGGDSEEYEAVDANDRFEQGLTVYDGSGEFWAETEALAAGPQPFTNARDHVDIINAIDFILLYVNGNCESEFRAAGSRSRNVPFKSFLKDADGYLRDPGNRSVLDDGPLDLMAELRDEGDPDYTILVADRIHKHFFNDGALSPAASIERLQDRVDETQLSFIMESARWGFRSPSSWQAYQDNLIDNFLPGQAATMIGKFKDAGMYPEQDAPVFSQHGGEVPGGTGPTISVSSSDHLLYYIFGAADTDPDDYVNSLDPRLPGGGINSAADVVSFSGNGAVNTVIVKSGDIWSYLDDGSNQGTAWRATNFNDSSWSSGPSQLGYGDEDEATVVGFIDTDPGQSGDQKNATTYFRKSAINIPDLSIFENLTLSYVYDDSIAIYINGSEVERRNVDVNPDFDEFANDQSDDNETGSITLPTSAFIEGNNTIAVEIHNRSAGSSDISFDLTLTGNPPGSGELNSPPVSITSPGWLLSRTFDPSTGEWSALNEAFFTPETVPADASNLVISEFHYHPAEPSSPDEIDGGFDADDFEFVEFMNVGSQPIDMEGVVVSSGINFTFGSNNTIPSGGRMLIVENAGGFAVRYSGQIGSLRFGTDSVGSNEYAGKLSNGGEPLVITDASGVLIQDFTYSDNLPWPPEADGEGSSLVLISPEQLPDHSLATNWTAGNQPGGNPGGAALFGFQGDPDADDDSDGFSAFLEYALGSSDSVAGDSALESGIGAFLVDGETEEYMVVSHQRNLHAVNAVTIEPQLSGDLEEWSGIPDVVFVSETDNLDGTSTVVYRSALPIGERASGREFIRLRVEN